MLRRPHHPTPSTLHLLELMVKVVLRGHSTSLLLELLLLLLLFLLPRTPTYPHPLLGQGGHVSLGGGLRGWGLCAT